MSLSSLKSELNGCTIQNLMPARWPIEALISWCREVARHNAGVLEPSEDDELFEALNSYIEKLLLAQDAERLHRFRQNSDSLFDVLARELDDIVRNELVSRIIDYGIDPVALRDLFRHHFAAGFGLVAPAHAAEQSCPPAAHTEPAL